MTDLATKPAVADTRDRPHHAGDGPARRGLPRRALLAPLALIGAVVGVPLFLTAPGQVLADIDAALLLDPRALLDQGLSMWDPGAALGTVPQTRVGTIWPAAPVHWLAELAGIPDWIAQRLWIAALVLGAAAGVLRLGRTWRWTPPAAVAAAFTYVLSPAVLTSVAPRSTSLLTFALLPWLLAVVVEAGHRGGWRHPALFGLLVALCGPSNPGAVVLIGLVPLLWTGYAVFGARTVGRARGLTTAFKLTVVAVAVNIWWVVALSVRYTNGTETFRYASDPERAASASSASELLRGLGAWPLYADDPTAPITADISAYGERLPFIGMSFVLPALALLGLGIVRWRHRTYVVGLLALGLLVSVGAHPWGGSSVVARLVAEVQSADWGLALQDLHQAAPTVLLPVALGVGSLVAALAAQAPRRGLWGAGVVAVVAVAALPGLWTGALVPEELRRPSDLPDHWEAAAAALSAGEGRVLELPGSLRHRFTWGTSAGPFLDDVVDRPHVVRELLPQGSPASADLLRALDVAAQEGSLQPAAIEPLARLLGISDVVIRNDLVDQGPVAPGAVWELLTSSRAIGEPTTYGAPGSAADDGTPLVPGRPDLPAVGVLSVAEAQPGLRARPAGALVLLSGDGAGIVDAAGAGVLAGDELIRYSAELTADPDFVVDQLVGERALVVTDTNRKRAARWDGLVSVDGYTEQADGGALRDDPHDRRLPVLPAHPGTRSVAEHDGVAVRATGYGSPDRYLPDHRPAMATDGDPTTAWLVGVGDRAVGHRIELSFPEAVATGRIRLQQAGSDGRRITTVDIRFDGGEPFTVELDERSRRPDGQVLDFPARGFQTLSIEIVDESLAALDDHRDLEGIGFREIGVVTMADPDGVVTEEVVRMPDDLLRAGGYRTRRYPLAIVQTRARDPHLPQADEERTIERALRLPVTRSFSLSGRARITRTEDSPPALLHDSGCRDDLVRVDGNPVRVRVHGRADEARAGSQIDLVACDGPIELRAGDHRFSTADERDSGIAVDQLVWRSAAGGGPDPLGGTILERPASPDSTDPESADPDSATPDSRSPDTAGAELTVSRRSATEADLRIAGAAPGSDFWVVLGESHDGGWALDIEEATVEGPFLVDGYANGWLVSPTRSAFDAQLRFVPQNRVEVGVLVGLVALAVAVVLLVLPARELRPLPIPLLEPLRRLRALTYEGALPTVRQAQLIGIVSGVVAAAVIHPATGPLVGLVAGFTARRESWRPLLTIVPAGLLAMAGVAVVTLQYRNDFAFGPQWPDDVGRVHPLVMVAVLLLVIDVVVDRVWVLRSDYR